MPSGKQILLSLLSEYSQKKTVKSKLIKVTERLKAGLLLHGSTANFIWKTVEQLTWLEKAPNIEQNDPEVKTQGLGLRDADILLSDLFDLITEEETVPQHIKETYPEITPKAYQAGVHTIRLLLKATEWSKIYDEVENNGEINDQEKERLLKNYQQKLVDYRGDPEDYS